MTQIEHPNPYWLIERGTPAEWWAGTDRAPCWTRDVNHVHPLLKFPTREQAQGEADRIQHWPMVHGSELRVTEHLDLPEPPHDQTSDKKVLVAWGDDVALRGPDAPKNDGMLKHLIEYLLTVYKRFGNTTVTADLQWGATALWKRNEEKERIEQLEGELALAERRLATSEELRTGLAKALNEVPSARGDSAALEAIQQVLHRGCTNPNPIGDSACECCQHHWHSLQRYVGEKP